jgi:hypothetical protein
MCCRPKTPPEFWGWSDDGPKNYVHGKFMLTLGDLIAERWEVRRFHIWYMEAVKAGLHNYVIKISAVLFHMSTDGEVIVDFHDMHRLLRRKDLDVAHVILFAM